MKIFTMNIKSAVTLLVISLASGATASADPSGGTITHSLDFSPDNVVAETITASDGKEYLMVSSPDSYEFGEPGDISLPYRFVSFVVPVSTNKFSVSITSSESSSKSIDASRNPYPIQEPQTTDGSSAPAFTPLNINSTGFGYSPKVAQEYVVNGNAHIVTMAIPLGEYSADTKSINLYKSARIALSYNVCDSSELPFTPMSAPSTELDIDVSELVLNTENISNFAPASLKKHKARYYILTPEYLEPYVHDIAGWKRQKGFDVTVKTYEEIADDLTCDVVDSEESFDPEAHLRNWLKNERKKYGTFYLLLIGDERAGAPIRKYRDKPVDSEHPEYENYNHSIFVPTDSYFSDLTSKLNLSIQQNGYYSALNSRLFYSPLLPVGRILAYEPKHLENYFHKLLVYECDPGFGDTSYLDRGLITKQTQTLNTPTIFTFFTGLTNVSTIHDQELNDSFENNRPTGAFVLDNMKGKGLISMHGHGLPYSIAIAGLADEATDKTHLDYRYIKAKECYKGDSIRMNPNEINCGIDLLNNIDKPFILHSIACEVCPFDKMYVNDNFQYPDDYLNIGASFTVGGKYGGVIFIGNTRYGETPYSSNLEMDFGRELNKNYSVGRAFVSSQFPIPHFQLYKHHIKYTRSIIGSPDLYVWRGEPEAYDVNIKISGTDIYLSGSDLKKSVISFYDGSQICKTSSVPNSLQNISFDSNSLGLGNDFAITLVKFNSLPVTKIFANQSTVANTDKKYFLNKGEIKNTAGAENPCFLIRDNGILEITATRELKTERAFNIGMGGLVSITNMSGETNLTHDTVTSGGKFEICSKETFIGEGFTVEKGGELTIFRY